MLAGAQTTSVYWTTLLPGASSGSRGSRDKYRQGWVENHDCLPALTILVVLGLGYWYNLINLLLSRGQGDCDYARSGEKSWIIYEPKRGESRRSPRIAP